ncbi:eukaryotic translation initiation factor 4 gamma 3-like isoform X2 [Gigantopelta aegis]|uniref:eukaryotic translation initiation factor 4 gamma 3-like isoform X2 n=1 Tax=Gigantopelta aegis TaxID=1735272 RepID=UPI001B88978E|nr:eukaryotic translation initiation factor 4 gamma 3-like isoform X2 [Gigantopelta aegis]
MASTGSACTDPDATSNGQQHRISAGNTGNSNLPASNENCQQPSLNTWLDQNGQIIKVCIPDSLNTSVSAQWMNGVTLQLQQLISAVAKLSSTVTWSRSTVEELSTTVKESKSTVKELHSKVTESRQVVKELNSKVKQLNPKVTALFSTVKKSTSTIKNFSSTVTELSSTVKKSTSTIKDFSSTVTELRSTVKESNSTVKDLSSKVQNVYNEIGSLKASVEDVQNRSKESDAFQCTSRKDKFSFHSMFQTSTPEDNSEHKPVPSHEKTFNSECAYRFGAMQLLAENASNQSSPKILTPSLTANRQNCEQVGNSTLNVAELSKSLVQLSKVLAVQSSKTVVESTKRVVEISRTMVGSTRPVVEISKTVFGSTKPVVEISKTVVESTRPVVEISKIMVESSKPMVEVSKPSVEVSKPAIEEETEKSSTQHSQVQIVITEPASMPKEVEIEITDAKMRKDSEVSRENAENSVKTNETNTEKTESVTQKYKYKEALCGPSQRGRGGMGKDGWNTVSSKAGMRNIKRNIDLSKLRINKSSDDNIQLGPGGGSRFGGWGRGSSGGGSRASQEGERPNTPGNRYVVLSKEIDHRSRAFGRGSSPHRGQGRTPGSFQKGQLGGHGSQELERERTIASARTIVSGRTTPPSAPASREGSRTREPRQKETEKQAEAVKEWTVDEMELKTRAIIDEFLHIQDKKEAVLCVTELRCPSMIHIFVQTAINHVLERSKPARRQTGAFLHDLIRQNVISVDTYLKGLTELLQFAEDMEIDIPKIWKYLGELIGPMVQDGSVPLSFLQQACKPLIENNKAGILIAEILHDASQELGHKIVGDLWRSSGLQWSDFVPHQEVEQFLKDKNLEFTVGPSSQPSTPASKVSFDKICDDLKEQLTQPHCEYENVFDWIEANVSEETTKDPRFIRALMTAVCSSALSGSGNMAKVDPESIMSRRALLQKYLEHKALFELQALYALQSLVYKLENPPGVLRTFFETLYDEEIISEDAFNQWENGNDPAEMDGKGVALKQVVQFFAWFREGS